MGLLLNQVVVAIKQTVHVLQTIKVCKSDDELCTGVFKKKYVLFCPKPLRLWSWEDQRSKSSRSFWHNWCHQEKQADKRKKQIAILINFIWNTAVRNNNKNERTFTYDSGGEDRAACRAKVHTEKLYIVVLLLQVGLSCVQHCDGIFCGPVFPVGDAPPPRLADVVRPSQGE